MQERFKSALERIEADEALVSRTEVRLQTELTRNQAPTNFVKGRIYEMKKFAIAACLALLLIGGGFVYATPTSYMCVDINPSIELGVNAFDRVISVEAMNDDGQSVLDELGKLKGMSQDDAVELIVEEAVLQKFFKDGDEPFVQLTVVTDNDKKAGKLLEDAENGALLALEKHGSDAEVGQAAISHARRDAAKAAGISPGKLNLLQKLWLADEDNEIPADADADELEGIFDEILEMENKDTDKAYADGSVKDIMKAIKKIRVEDKEGIEEDSEDSEDGDDDDVTPGNGKVIPPGQLKKMPGSADDDEGVYLPNGKIKKNGQGAWGIDDNDDDDD